jgi:hypothetical protein
MYLLVEMDVKRHNIIYEFEAHPIAEDRHE